MGKRLSLGLLAALCLAAAFGCASAYHCYPCGRVGYGYCPEPPLPYTQYCACPTPIAARFQQQQAYAASPPAAPLPPRGDAGR